MGAYSILYRVKHLAYNVLTKQYIILCNIPAQANIPGEPEFNVEKCSDSLLGY